MNSGKRRLCVSAMGLSAALLAVSAAWACTGQPQVVALSTDRAPVGTEVTVIGQQVPTEYVEVRWDSVHGPVVGTGFAKNGDFAVQARVPETAPGIYYMVVAALPLGYPEGTPPTVTRVSFEVTSSPAGSSERSPEARSAANVSTDLWRGFSSLSDGPASLASATQSQAEPAVPALGIGVGIFAFGAAALIFASGTAIAVRRRPAVGPASRR